MTCYQKFDNPFDAGKAVGNRLAVRPREHVVLSYYYISAGVEIEPYFTRHNYISLFWGDMDAQWVRDLSNIEKRQFEQGVRAILGPHGRERGLIPQTKTDLTRKWYDKGVEAGKTDGWMEVEKTIKETKEYYPQILDPMELVWQDIELWETTDHFTILYGSKMMDDAQGDFDLYADLKSEFWEGYLTGRKQIGIDIYKIASELLKGREREIKTLRQAMRDWKRRYGEAPWSVETKESFKLLKGRAKATGLSDEEFEKFWIAETEVKG